MPPYVIDITTRAEFQRLYKDMAQGELDNYSGITVNFGLRVYEFALPDMPNLKKLKLNFLDFPDETTEYGDYLEVGAVDYSGDDLVTTKSIDITGNCPLLKRLQINISGEKIVSTVVIESFKKLEEVSIISDGIIGYVITSMYIPKLQILKLVGVFNYPDIENYVELNVLELVIPYKYDVLYEMFNVQAPVYIEVSEFNTLKKLRQLILSAAYVTMNERIDSKLFPYLQHIRLINAVGKVNLSSFTNLKSVSVVGKKCDVAILSNPNFYYIDVELMDSNLTIAGKFEKIVYSKIEVDSVDSVIVAPKLLKKIIKNIYVPENVLRELAQHDVYIPNTITVSNNLTPIQIRDMLSRYEEYTSLFAAAGKFDRV